MNLYQRYLFRQALWPFLATIGALSGLAVLTQSLSNIDMIANQSETAFVFVWVTILAMPQLIALLLPIAVFIAVAISLNRLVSDSELTVSAASGMSRLSRIAPFLRLGVYALLANLAINLFVQPISFRQMREVVYEIRTDMASRFMQSGEFISLGQDVTFYARSVDDAGVMQDVFIQDGNDEDASAYAARYGLLTQTERGPLMLLEDGMRSWTDENGELATIAFDRTEFDLTAFLDSTSAFYFKESDKFLSELLDPTIGDIARASSRADLYAEGHYRLAATLYNFAFALMAVTAFLAFEHRRTGYARFIMIAAGLALLVRMIGFAAQSAATGNEDLNFLQYLIPIMAISGSIVMMNRPSRFWKKIRGESRPALEDNSVPESVRA